MFLIYLSQQLNIYGCLVIFITGIVGNGLIIFIFLRLRTYRNTPCTFYFLISSICNSVYILINIAPRILKTTYSIDLTIYSLFWCKFQHFMIGFLSLTSFSCTCLATIDQFFATSRNPILRRYSNIKIAHKIVIIVVLVSCLHAIPLLIFYEILPGSKTCNNINSSYEAYFPIYIILFLCIIPVSIIVVFGCMAYRNIRQTVALAEQQADRQLAKMILIQAIFSSISIIPMGSILIYSLFTENVKKDLDRQLKEYLAVTIAILFSYLHYVGGFYMFLISSNRFRQTVGNQIVFWKPTIRIHPSVAT